MDNAGSPQLERRLAGRVRGLRVARGLTLDDLAQRSGVSRSAISLIERAECSPTANLLDKLAASLGVSLADLFTEEATDASAPIARRADQLAWRDPATGYLRRNLSPAAYPSPIELVEVVLPAGGRVAYDSGPRTAAVDQQIWVLDGTIEVSIGAEHHALAVGDCLAMRVDRPVTFGNPLGTDARYLVALVLETVGSVAPRVPAKVVT
jgi:transcriptional regulator with XRE-family HTH domain